MYRKGEYFFEVLDSSGTELTPELALKRGTLIPLRTAIVEFKALLRRRNSIDAPAPATLKKLTPSELLALTLNQLKFHTGWEPQDAYLDGISGGV